MKSINAFIKDESGTMIIYWIIALVGLLFLVIAYAFTIPLGNILINTFTAAGAPIAQMLFIRTMTIWGFAILGVLLLMIAFMGSYLTDLSQQQRTG